MIIGVDIDGVVSDSYSFWLGELNRHYGKEIKELHTYEMDLIYDVPWEEMNNFFISNVETLFMTPLPMPGAKEGLEMLKANGHEILLVTARREVEEEDVTARWLSLHGIPYDKLMLVGERSKAEVCKEHSIELFVEDYDRNARAIDGIGIKTIILDASYNRVELPESIMRCYSWNQIVEEIQDRC
jgi:uncharacterized protein